MSSKMSTYDMLWKCKRFILSDPKAQHIDGVIEDALITACREIGSLGGPMPMSWLRESYDELFTRYYATVSDVTQASPGVITADSVDPDLTSNHGFTSGTHFVYLDGFGGGMERLNRRVFRLKNISDTTFSLLTIDGQTGIDTSDYEEYSAGGTIYHAGIVLPASTIAAGTWTIEKVWKVTFDGNPTEFITEERAIEDGWIGSGGIPEKVRYQQYTYSTFEDDNIEHWLWWYGMPGQRYNINVKLEKTYPDLSKFSDTVKTYSPHPAKIDDYIWHRALANLATQAEKQRRQTLTKDGVRGDNTKMEIVNANYWLLKKIEDEAAIRQYNLSLLGVMPKPSGGMSA